jgi:hypothetical protein
MKRLHSNLAQRAWVSAIERSCLSSMAASNWPRLGETMLKIHHSVIPHACYFPQDYQSLTLYKGSKDI